MYVFNGKIWCLLVYRFYYVISVLQYHLKVRWIIKKITWHTDWSLVIHRVSQKCHMVTKTSIFGHGSYLGVFHFLVPWKLNPFHWWQKNLEVWLEPFRASNFHFRQNRVALQIFVSCQRAHQRSHPKNVRIILVWPGLGWKYLFVVIIFSSCSELFDKPAFV